MLAVDQPGVLGLIVENIGGGELVVIAFLALVVLGPERIPEMARGAGRLINKVRAMSKDLTGDMAEVMNDPSMQPIRELGEFATRPRQKLAEYALEAEAEERQRRADSAAADTTAGDTAAGGTAGTDTAAGETAVDGAAGGLTVPAVTQDAMSGNPPVVVDRASETATD